MLLIKGEQQQGHGGVGLIGTKTSQSAAGDDEQQRLVEGCASAARSDERG